MTTLVAYDLIKLRLRNLETAIIADVKMYNISRFVIGVTGRGGGLIVRLPVGEV